MQAWLAAIRPRTLPAAVVPVAVGTAAASTPVEDIDGVRALLALAVALALQVAVNFANDVFDAESGVDTADRLGPPRMVATGRITPTAMKVGIAGALLVAGAAGLVLAAMTSWWLLAVGAACGLAALGYSGGPRPYASMGLGELLVFVFFGLVATVGSQWIQDEAFNGLAWVAAVPVGLLAVALLVVNNLRDIPTDDAAGKRTLAVRLGDARTRQLLSALVVMAFALVPAIAAVAGDIRVLLLLVLLLPANGRVLGPVRRGATGRDLVTILGQVAALHLGFGLLLALFLFGASA